MLDIQKEYNDEYIVYECIGSINNTTDLEGLLAMLREDIVKTYAFIFSFRSLTYIDTQAIEMLQEIYKYGVSNACEMTISGLNPQPAMMVEIFQIDRLYSIKKTLKEATDIYYGEDYELAYYNEI